MKASNKKPFCTAIVPRTFQLSENQWRFMILERQFAEKGVVDAKYLDAIFEMKQSRWMDWVINAN